MNEVEIYRNRLQKVTNLNKPLFQYPPVLSAIFAGLWYFASQQIDSDPWLARGVFTFAALVGVVGVLAVLRTSHYLHDRIEFTYELENIALDKRNALKESTQVKEGSRNKARLNGLCMATIMVILLAGGTLLSTGGVVYTFFRPAVANCP